MATLPKISASPTDELQAYLIIWEDAKSLHEGNGWQTREVPSYTPYLVHQVGFVVLCDDAVVQLTDSYTPDFTGPITQIPRGMIRSMKRL